VGKHQNGERKGSRGCSGSQRDFCSQLIGKVLQGAQKSTQRSSFQSAAVPLKLRARCAPVVPCARCVSSTHSTTKSSLGFGAALPSASDVDSARNELCDACAPFRSFKNLCRQRNCKLLQPARHLLCVTRTRYAVGYVTHSACIAFKQLSSLNTQKLDYST
jgi:hypothetical protein